MVAGTRGGMKVSEWEDGLIKYYILRYIDSPFGDIKTHKPLMHIVVTKEHTL
jgi:hypothetical protein